MIVMTMEQARKFPAIKALRDAYRTLGNDPTRYRGSNEALVRRITQGKELFATYTFPYGSYLHTNTGGACR
jgi:DNA/RNA-binding domain of Phe-tRNA-synthetase-like protein